MLHANTSLPDESLPCRGLLDEQFRRNRRTQSGWELYRSHRDQITNLLLADRPAGSSLSILGAGNCNDLDLLKLLGQFRHIELVDLDPEALEQGCRFQGCYDDSRVLRCGGIDVSGIAPRLNHWLTKDNVISDKEIDQALRELILSHKNGMREAKFGLVASVGLLSQLLEPVVQSLSPDHPRLPELIAAVRRQHCELLLERTAKGGTAILVTELVSSDTLPEMLTAKPSELPGLLQAAAANHNFFTGLHPGTIASQIAREPTISKQLKSLRITNPWIWNFFSRSYACLAFVMQKRLD